VFAEQPRAPARIRTWPIGRWLREYLDPIARGVDCHEAEADQSAKPVDMSVALLLTMRIVPLSWSYCTRRENFDARVRVFAAIHEKPQRAEARISVCC
jgi:hypothetical protein